MEEFTSRVSIMYSCAVTADGRGRSYCDACPPKSDTNAADLFGVVTHANGPGDESLPRTNETVLIPDPDTPPPTPAGCLSGPEWSRITVHTQQAEQTAL